jgi:molecular chaperone HscA
MDAVRTVIGGSDHQAIKRAVEALNMATTEFAQRRMDQSVKHALTGHRLADLEG